MGLLLLWVWCFKKKVIAIYKFLIYTVFSDLKAILTVCRNPLLCQFLCDVKSRQSWFLREPSHSDTRGNCFSREAWMVLETRNFMHFSSITI